ncbi:hypothetical protein NF27_AA00020 [Candidatus Jidaibacter acanthamoeba]|uniref:Uncharacterized protein n=1 Tax=Candidatus Jidaibacter acanthamoebae TaxID=86105 RepID=A0A0C1QLC2_9RICK|nr:ankyrin repeat domain-containing protein [Candidatus Jidaibacter acanthamoeba]KIE04229.1 hypothetical protein NF27_IS00020 [Candidatus Jidaibacter acanthamoeba]KIE06304.1 hypothetical protein NF27_AA00020 [Candidatus Jidaibacter acanthamoeba]
MIEKNTQFYEAIEKGDKQKVIELINEDPTLLGYTIGDGTSAIHWATYEGYNEIIEFLISKGVDVNAETDEGETALHIAAYEGYNQTVELLYRNGAVFSPLEVYDNLQEGIKGNIIKDEKLIKIIRHNMIRRLEELSLIQLSTIGDNTDNIITKIKESINFGNNPFMELIIDALVISDIKIENDCIQSYNVENIFDNLYSQSAYNSYYKCLYFFIENGFRLSDIVSVAEPAHENKQDVKKQRIENPAIEQEVRIKRKIPKLFAIIAQHIANGSINECRGYASIYQRIQEDNIAVGEVIVPMEVKEKILDCLVDRRTDATFEVLPSKQEANSWISKALKQEFIILRSS